MKIEHTAFQVSDPVALARWYVDHLGLRIKRAQSSSPFGHFLADDGDTVMLEFYNNPALPVPDYRAINSLALHVAYLTDDMPATFDRLVAAGASPENPMRVSETGDRVAMLRDPWGLPIQLITRAEPMLG